MARSKQYGGAYVGDRCLPVSRLALHDVAHDETLPPFDQTLDFAVGAIFTLVEFLSMLGATMALIFLTRTRNRTPEANANVPWLKSLPEQPLVDVLICTYNEEEAILERTIIGALGIDYPRYRLWVCDDGRRQWLKDLASARLRLDHPPRQSRTPRQATSTMRCGTMGASQPAEIHPYPRRRFRPKPVSCRGQCAYSAKRSCRHRPDAAAFHQSGPDPDEPRSVACLAR